MPLMSRATPVSYTHLIGKGSVIENCVILQNTVIGSNVMMNHAITDKGTLIDDSEEVKGLRENPVVIPKKRVV